MKEVSQLFTDEMIRPSNTSYAHQRTGIYLHPPPPQDPHNTPSILETPPAIFLKIEPPHNNPLQGGCLGPFQDSPSEGGDVGPFQHSPITPPKKKFKKRVVSL